MLAPVLEHVHERVAHLTWRGQVTRVVPFFPDASTPAKSAVDRLRDPDREPLDSPLERVDAVALDEQVNVIALNTEVQQSKSAVRCACKCCTHREEDVVASQ